MRKSHAVLVGVFVSLACTSGAAERQATPDASLPAAAIDDTSQGDGYGECIFSLLEASVSPAIGTVGIVRFAVTSDAMTTVDAGLVNDAGQEPNIEQAQIEFSLADGSGDTLTAEVDVAAADYRTLLLGMKGDREYAFRINVDRGRCVSTRYTLTTEPTPNWIPVVEREVLQPDKVSRGFIVTSGGVGSGWAPSDGDAGGLPESSVFILDSDGEVVWWTRGPFATSRARLDWDAERMLMVGLNVGTKVGEVRSSSLDGLDVDKNLSGLGDSHHDIAALPGGGVAALSYGDGCSRVLERRADGHLLTVVDSVAELYEPAGSLAGGDACHPNAIVYHPNDDTFTISDRNADLFVKITRDGQLLWQLGGTDPKGNHFEVSSSWLVNHGHQVLPNGNFLLFNNAGGGASPVLEYALDEANWSATLVWEYASDLGSATLGDVQRLPNGNTLITYSNAGTIAEVDPGGQLVQVFTTDPLGYAMHRTKLSGPPPK